MSRDKLFCFNRPPAEDDIVGVTIGNFDGMHLGHQALFSELDQSLQKLASITDSPSYKVLFSFAPHPRNILSGADSNTLNGDSTFWEVTPLRHKLALAADLGFDAVCIVRFSKSFAKLSPTEFVQTYLVSKLQAQVVVVGYDWSFGKGRAGTAETLQQLGSENGFDVSIVDPFSLGDVRVSSSVVKEALAAGDLARLQQLLGRAYGMYGRVVHGDKRGREIGFPTANIVPKRQIVPPKGVYAVEAYHAGKKFRAVCNIGVRPTFGLSKRLVETHFLDEPSESLYGSFLRLVFLEKIRDEKKFCGIVDLRDQITKDIGSAVEIHKRVCA